MVLVTKTIPGWLEYTGNTGGALYRTANAIGSRKEIPAKASGSWVVLPNGGRFRRATGRVQFHYWVEPGAPQSSEGYRFVNGTERHLYARSSPGGDRAGEALGVRDGWHDAQSTGLGHLTGASIPTSRRNEVYTKALLKIADQKVGVGENLGTMLQTLRMLANPTRALTSSIHSLVDGSPKHLKRFLRFNAQEMKRRGAPAWFADRYLEYVYGWKPLISDIYGGLELLKSLGKTPLLVHGHATSFAENTLSGDSGVGSNSGVKSVISTNKVRSRVRCHLWGRIDPNSAWLRTLNQAGLANPLAIAWELVPFSFVVDWLLPIGPVLNAYSAPAGLIFLDGTISNRISATGSYEQWYTSLDSWISGVHANGTVRAECYTRERITSWPRPGLYLDFDPFKGDRPFKALALIVSNLRSLRM